MAENKPLSPAERAAMAIIERWWLNAKHLAPAELVACINEETGLPELLASAKRLLLTMPAGGGPEAYLEAIKELEEAMAKAEGRES